MATYTYNLNIGNNHYLSVSLTESSQSTTDNSTTINYTITFHTENNYYHYSNNNQLWLTINGVVISANEYVGSIWLENHQSKVIKSGTIVVPHNADGTKTVRVYMRFQQYAFPYDANNTWDIALTRINRGLSSIYTGTGFADCQINIYHNGAFTLYQPYIYHNGEWVMY